MASTLLGRVGMLPKGPWSETATYEKLDVVSSDGNSFVALKPSTGIQPTNTEYWMALTENQPFIENANAAKEAAQQAAASAQNAVNQANQAIQAAGTAATNANNAATNANNAAAGVSGQITTLEQQISGKADAFQVGTGMSLADGLLSIPSFNNMESLGESTTSYTTSALAVSIALSSLLYIEITVPSSSTTYSGSVTLTGNGGVAFTITSAISSSTRYIKIFVDCRNNRLNIIYTNSTSSSSNSTAYWLNRSGVGDVKTVRFSATGGSSVTLPVGTKVTVYGVKAE